METLPKYVSGCFGPSPLLYKCLGVNFRPGCFKMSLSTCLLVLWDSLLQLHVCKFKKQKTKKNCIPDKKWKFLRMFSENSSSLNQVSRSPVVLRSLFLGCLLWDMDVSCASGQLAVHGGGPNIYCSSVHNMSQVLVILPPRRMLVFRLSVIRCSPFPWENGNKLDWWM